MPLRRNDRRGSDSRHKNVPADGKKDNNSSRSAASRAASAVDSLKATENQGEGQAALAPERSGHLRSSRKESTKHSLVRSESSTNPSRGLTQAEDKVPGGRTAVPAPEDREVPVNSSRDTLIDYGHLAESIHRFCIDQSQLKWDHDTGLAMLENLEQSLTSLQSEGRSARVSSNTTSKTQVSEEQFASDVQKFKDHMKVVFDRHQSLATTAFRLGEKLPALISPLFPRLQRERQQNPLEGPPRETISPSEAPSDVVDSRQVDYEEKRGDVRLARDQLDNHLSERTELILEYGTHQQGYAHPYDLNAPTETSIEGTQQRSPLVQWSDEHIEMYRKYQEDERELLRLWKICKDAGLDVGNISDEISVAVGTASSSAEQEGIDPSIPPFVNVNEDTALSRYFKERSGANHGAIISESTPTARNRFKTRELVDNWQGDIPDSAPSPEAPDTPASMTTSKDEGG